MNPESGAVQATRKKEREEARKVLWDIFTEIRELVEPLQVEKDLEDLRESCEALIKEQGRHYDEALKKVTALHPRVRAEMEKAAQKEYLAAFQAASKELQSTKRKFKKKLAA